MSTTRKASKILIVLLAMIFVSFLACTVLPGRSNSPQPPATSTVTPEVEFVSTFPLKTFWGNYLAVSVEAIPGANCKLTYMSPSGALHEVEAIANESGLCEGRWKIEEAEGKGAGRLNFSIGDFSETHFIEVRSSF